MSHQPLTDDWPRIGLQDVKQGLQVALVDGVKAADPAAAIPRQGGGVNPSPTTVLVKVLGGEKAGTETQDWGGGNISDFSPSSEFPVQWSRGVSQKYRTGSGR